MRTAEQAMLEDAYYSAFKTPPKSRAVQQADGNWQRKDWKQAIVLDSSDDEAELDLVPVSQRPRMSLATAIAASNALRKTPVAVSFDDVDNDGDEPMRQLEQDMAAAADNRSSWNLLKANELCKELDNTAEQMKRDMQVQSRTASAAAAASTPFISADLFVKRPLAGTTRSGTKRV